MTQHVTDLLERATTDLRARPDLVAAGIAAGRRRRRRGLAGTAAGVLAAAAVGGVALTLPGSAPGGDRTVITDPSSSSSASFAGQPATHLAPQVDPSYDGAFPLPPEAMAATLATLLDGTVTNPADDQYHLAGPDGWQSGAVDLDGAAVTVAYQHSTGPRCDGDLARGNDSCTALGGGFFLSTYSAEVTTVDGKTGVRDVGVTYYTPDRYKISATASNGSSTDSYRPTRDEPVLDQAALTAIAQDPAWR